MPQMKDNKIYQIRKRIYAYETSLTIDQIQPQRTKKKKLIKRKTLLYISTTIFISILIGVYFYAKGFDYDFHYNPPYSFWVKVFLFILGIISIRFLVFSAYLKRNRMLRKSFQRIYELGEDGVIYLTKYEGICPECGVKSSLKKHLHYPFVFICTKFPKDHKFTINEKLLLKYQGGKDGNDIS